jgi:hypothetical protein
MARDSRRSISARRAWPANLLPVGRGVTHFTAPTEGAFMHVFLAVASDAERGRRRDGLALGRRLNVTSVTRNLGVLAFERVLGALGVVELPQTPVTRVVATTAVAA